ncbi:regulation of axon guidance [Paramecium bursaria]
MNNIIAQGIYKSVRLMAQQQQIQPNYDDDYNCFCQKAVPIEPFDDLYNHIKTCTSYLKQSTFMNEYNKMSVNLLRVPHLLAMKAELLNIICKIDELTNQKIKLCKSPSSRTSSSHQQFQSNLVEIMKKQRQQKAFIKCQLCGKNENKDLEVEVVIKLGCEHNFCVGCLRKQINLDYINQSGHVNCKICDMKIDKIEDIIGKERLQHLKVKLRTGESPTQSVIPCFFCQKYLRSKDVQQGSRAVCSSKECQNKSKMSCVKQLKCTHFCSGYINEKTCLNCLQCSVLGQEYCGICCTESLVEGPCIQSLCGHIFHYNCVLMILEKKWVTQYISFSFCMCTLCKRWLEFPKDSLPQKMMTQFNEIFCTVRQQAQLRVGKIGDAQALKIEDVLEQSAFYLCVKCNTPFFGGTKDCQLDIQEQKEQILCPSCSGIDSSKCAQHGTDYLEYKCRFCCNVATYFCWGNTHFCKECHIKQSNGQYLNKLQPNSLPQCIPVKCKSGGKHKPNGQECCLGCSLCRIKS